MAGLMTRWILVRNAKLLSASSSVVCLQSQYSTFERDRKSGYPRAKSQPVTKHFKDGMKLMKTEMKILSREIKEKLLADPFLDLQHGDYGYEFKLNSREEVNSWLITTDHDNSEGKSTASFVLTTNNTGMFHGYLSQEVPKDGIKKRSGYANIRSPSNFKSFKRKISYDWSLFNCLVLRVRGDGRTYMINIQMNRHYDVNWGDQYHYPLYTHGGPYWQIAKIPFSKFYLTSKGRVQDKQEPIDLTCIANMGITLGDGVEGDFSLEIDYVALLYDENHYETFAYELYEASPAHVGT